MLIFDTAFEIVHFNQLVSFGNHTWSSGVQTETFSLQVAETKSPELSKFFWKILENSNFL